MARGNVYPKVIVYTRADGRVCVVGPTREFLARFATEAEGLAAIVAKDVPATATNVAIIDVVQLPNRKTTVRNLWRQLGATAPVTT